MAKSILITGANGQLGTEMRNLLKDNKDFYGVFTDVKELDITSPEAVSNFFGNQHFDYVVNCAAFTSVDAAEDNPEFCELLNADAVEYLAKAAKKQGAKMIHVSTDYVFNGCGYRPYVETDKTEGCSVYGKTKLHGEQKLLAVMPDAIILRTAWLYSPYGKNFVKTMISLGQSKESLKVICDQMGTPTYAKDLAQAIITVLSAPEWHAGVYHFSNEGAISWYDFTKAIHRLAGIASCNVMPCTTEEYPTKAKRPHYSVLCKSKFKNTFGVAIPYWEESLEECIKRLNENN